MKWFEITVFTTDEGTDPVCDVLREAGMEGFTIEESREKAAEFLNESALYWDFADYENIGTDTPCVKTYLEQTEENAGLIRTAEEALNELRKREGSQRLGTLKMKVNVRDDEDWENNWKQYYKPMEIGERLLVLPSWEEMPETERTVLRLDPGMAFGTGSHQTTRMCLELIECNTKPGGEVLDIGCGSGILSIAAMLLGASEAVAVDIDPITKDIARENAEMNGVEFAHYHIKTGDILTDSRLKRLIEGKYDLVVANIVADVIIRLAPLAKTLCADGAPFIVSGIINERLEEVLKALSEAGFYISETRNMDDWNAVLCLNK